MSLDERFASLLGAWPPVGLLPRLDPAEGQVQGLLPAQPAPQSALGVLGVPGDPASLFAPPFDPMQVAGYGMGDPMSFARAGADTFGGFAAAAGPNGDNPIPAGPAGGSGSGQP